MLCSNVNAQVCQKLQCTQAFSLVQPTIFQVPISTREIYFPGIFRCLKGVSCARLPSIKPLVLSRINIEIAQLATQKSSYHLVGENFI